MTSVRKVYDYFSRDSNKLGVIIMPHYFRPIITQHEILSPKFSVNLSQYLTFLWSVADSAVQLDRYTLFFLRTPPCINTQISKAVGGGGAFGGGRPGWLQTLAQR